MRKLATIRTIKELRPIPGADMIELAVVDGWQIVVKKGEFQQFDRCVYLEIDSILDAENPHFKFMEKYNYRVKTIKLRKQLSQGLLFPTFILPNTNYNIGDDVTDILKITKYESPVSPQLAGIMKGNFPAFLRKTDEERLQNLDIEYFKTLNLNWHITEKEDGSSITAYKRNGEFGVCSRNIDLKETEGNTFWQVARQYKIEEWLPDNFAIQSEMCGPKIQGNKYKLDNYKLYAFNFWNIEKQEFENWRLGEYVGIIETVPFLKFYEKFPFETIDDALEFAKGKSKLNPNTTREGVVVRGYDKLKQLQISFKIINNDFLLENNE